MYTFTVNCRPDLDLVFLRWMAPDTLAEAQLADRDTLALALEHHCGNWLLAARRSGPPDLAETAWRTHEFFPEAVARLAPHPRRLAVFSSMLRLDQLRLDAIVAPAVPDALAATRPYLAALFTAEADAVAWLQQQPAEIGGSGGVIGGSGYEGHGFVGPARYGFALIGGEGKEGKGQQGLTGIEVAVRVGPHLGGRSEWNSLGMG